jgi:hypothetical protein
VDEHADIFKLRHPEFIDNEANGAKMTAVLIARARQATTNVEDLEEAYLVLREANALQLDTKVLEEQRQQRVAERAYEPVHSLNTLTEGELYSMPMAELERRAKGYL